MESGASDSRSEEAAHAWIRRRTPTKTAWAQITLSQQETLIKKLLERYNKETGNTVDWLCWPY